ncbi:MAG: 5-formyltetrahydrofolate cyclo-ligase [Bacteroidetes bacterium]|nr:5-formyltetrahydrofolate cyclo-ligase [Bacteroidota bacterium]
MTDELKKQIRKEIKQLKANLSFDKKLERSALIFSKLETNIFFQNAKSVLLYWSMEDEVQTHDFVIKWAHEKEIILPSVQNDILVLKKFEGIQNLKTGEKYAIQEPNGEEFENFDKIDVVIVPGIAFDREKNRMGRGKAYYDRLLIKLNAYKIAVCFDFQIIDSVPIDAHDIKMDEIICG